MTKLIKGEQTMKNAIIILIGLFTFALGAFYHTSAQLANVKQGTIYNVSMDPFRYEMPNVIIDHPMLGIPQMPY